MHPLVMETLAQQQLRNRRPGQLADVPEHLREDVWPAWALNYSGPGPVLRWLRRIAGIGRPMAVRAATVGRPAATVTRPAAVLAGGRDTAVIGCRG